MIVRHYGEQAVVEQAIDDLVEEMYPKILEEADIKPAAAGSLESIDNLEPPKLTFRVPLAPEVDLGDYRSIRKPYEWTAPDKTEVTRPSKTSVKCMQRLKLLTALFKAATTF